MYQLVALDIDGTLLNSSYQITDRVRQAVARVRQRNIQVVLVTGRTFPAARSIAEELDLNDRPLVSHNGALTKIPSSLAVVEARLLHQDAARLAVEAANRSNVTVLYSDDPDGPGNVVMGQPPAGRLDQYLTMTNTPVRLVSDLAASLDHPVIQVSCSGPCKKIDVLQSRLSRQLADEVTLILTAYRRRNLSILDVLDAGCSKGSGLQSALRWAQVDPNDVMAVGDNFNDLDMLQIVGCAVVMGNAPESMHHMGFPVTTNRDADGAALALEKWVLTDD
ncbi:MAG: HAD-IIB family hydrolase [Deltaproteobacteria bacterium]|nr:HAD-IIB family hydrolase [Deltaproteobacteria bacterium]